MKNEIIASSKDHNTDNHFLRKTTYIIIALIVVLILGSLIVNQIIPWENYPLQNSDGLSITAEEIRKNNVFNILLIVPLLGLVIGAFLSLIPFKNMHFKRKYLRFSLVSILVLYITQLVSYLSIL